MEKIPKKTQNVVNRLDDIISNSYDHIGHLGKNQKAILLDAYNTGLISTVESNDGNIAGFAHYKLPNGDRSKKNMINIYKFVVEPKYQENDFGLERKLLANIEEEAKPNIKELRYQIKDSDIRYASFLESSGFKKQDNSGKYPIWVKKLK